MFQKHSQSVYALALRRIEQKTLVHGDIILMPEFVLKN